MDDCKLHDRVYELETPSYTFKFVVKPERVVLYELENCSFGRRLYPFMNISFSREGFLNLLDLVRDNQEMNMGKITMNTCDGIELTLCKDEHSSDLYVRNYRTKVYLYIRLNVFTETDLNVLYELMK